MHGGDKASPSINLAGCGHLVKMLKNSCFIMINKLIRIYFFKHRIAYFTLLVGEHCSHMIINRTLEHKHHNVLIISSMHSPHVCTIITV